MPQAIPYTFEARPECRPQSPYPKSPPDPEPYIASAPLIRAVNLAIYLRRPLLLEGEAGCGKSRLARAVAYELGLPFYPWYVRSTTKAREGLYTYDAILRLHDVEMARLGAAAGPAGGEPVVRRDPSQPTAYRRLGPLGEAFAEPACPAVVLIDEIDKADVDFPNDLLAVLDDPWEFPIPETGEPPIQARHIPIVIITSNKEKGNLPAPFLRRCIYYFIEFPNDPAVLQQIVDIHYRTRQQATPQTELVQAAANRFLALRSQEMLHKKPGTSEFLDWLHALHRFGPQAPAPPERVRDSSAPFLYPELLFKLRMDWQRYAVAP
jgi:MoxR-like ATPase